ncbi:MAG: tetratricopeptide repeat protein [Planctomycetaceae bacterium]|nr:tetratricopeptide repeat protein [Planctomycetaceae bacterium]
MGRRELRFAMGAVVAAGLLAGGCLIGMRLLCSETPTLAEGFRRVEQADANSVDRIEQALLRIGARDEAAILRSAWLVRRARYQQALDRLTPDMIAGSLRPHVLRLAGECLFQLGQFDRAEPLLIQLVAEHPDELDAYRALAVMYYDLGSPDLALKALGHVIRLVPLDYRPHHLSGVILTDNENFTAAAKQFQLGLSKAPPEEIRRVMQHELAQALISLRDFQGALDALSGIQPSPGTDTQRAECFWSLGDARQAAHLVDEVLTNQPEHVNALKLKARFLEEAGQGERAVKLLQQALATEPFDLNARYQLLQLYGALGKNEERATELTEYNRYRELQNRLIELNQQANSDPDAEAPRRELVEVCRALGRQKLADMWQKAAEFCAFRQQGRKPQEAPQPSTHLKP